MLEDKLLKSVRPAVKGYENSSICLFWWNHEIWQPIRVKSFLILKVTSTDRQWDINLLYELCKSSKVKEQLNSICGYKIKD